MNESFEDNLWSEWRVGVSQVIRSGGISGFRLARVPSGGN
jgi:hypothetical protein